MSETKYLKLAETRSPEEFAAMFGCKVGTFHQYVKRRGWPTAREIRHDNRLRRIQQLLDEGVSAKQIQLSLGLSRQRYHQLLKKLETNPPKPLAPTVKPPLAKNREGTAGDNPQINFGLRRTHYQIVQGIWNPRDNNYSWVVFDDGLTIKEAREGIDEVVASSLNLGRMQKVTSAHRAAYTGAPMAIIEMTTKIVERVGNPERENATFADNRLGVAYTEYESDDEQAEAHPS